MAFNRSVLLEMLQMTDVKSCQFKLGPDTRTRRSPIFLSDEPGGTIGLLNQLRLDWL